LKAAGITPDYISTKERLRWIGACISAVDDWVKDMDASGLEGTALIKDVRQLLAEIAN
jgi:hypothetical protein